MTDITTLDPVIEPTDTASFADGTGRYAVSRELERDQVRTALFDGCAVPKIGQFAIAEPLGAGATSVVYAAWDTVLERRVAVKIFLGDPAAAHDQVQHNARALAQLTHRNVVAIYEVGEWNARAFIAMELISGMTLSRWQALPGRPLAAVVDTYLQAGLGLAAGHQAGLVHRDFKPTNVLVADDGRVVVTDFGLATGAAPSPAIPNSSSADRDLASATRPMTGALAYLAPEQQLGAPPHPSADIYSFAMSLCEALVGWHPMRHHEALWKHALARRVPPRIQKAICTGLARDPAVRGASIQPLLDALGPPRRRRRPSRAAAPAPARPGSRR